MNCTHLVAGQHQLADQVHQLVQLHHVDADGVAGQRLAGLGGAVVVGMRIGVVIRGVGLVSRDGRHRWRGRGRRSRRLGGEVDGGWPPPARPPRVETAAATGAGAAGAWCGSAAGAAAPFTLGRLVQPDQFGADGRVVAVALAAVGLLDEAEDLADRVHHLKQRGGDLRVHRQLPVPQPAQQGLAHVGGGNATRGAGQGVEEHSDATRADPQQRLVMEYAGVRRGRRAELVEAGRVLQPASRAFEHGWREWSPATAGTCDSAPAIRAG